MRKFKYLTIGAMALVPIAVTATRSNASQIAFQGFETTAPANAWTYSYDSYNAAAGTGIGAPSSTNPSSDKPASSRILGGSFSFQVTEPTANSAEEPSTLTFAPINITGDTGVQVDLNLAAISTTSGNGLDSEDYVEVFIALNGAAFSSTPDMAILGNGNSTWAYSTSAAETATVTVGTPHASFEPKSGSANAGFSLLELNIPDADNATSVAMEVISADNSTGEVWALDNISLNGTVPVPEPASLGLLAAGGAALLMRRRRKA